MIDYLIFGYIALSVVLILVKSGGFLLRFLVASFGIVMAVVNLGNDAILMYPWSLLMWIFVEVALLLTAWRD